MPVPKHIFREYDIRGLAEEELNSENVQAIAMAFGTLLKRRGIGRICLGGDVRPSTERIRRDVIEGITLAGIDITDIGVVTTPMLYWSLYHYGLNGGIMITGSHNPPEFNGLKLAVGKTTLYGKQIKEIYEMICKNDMGKSSKREQSLPNPLTRAILICSFLRQNLAPKAQSGNRFREWYGRPSGK